MIAPTVARAQTKDAVDEARAAYDRGAKAYDAGEYGRAVTELTRADEILPNPTVLELALKAAVKADDPAAGMTLVDRATSRGLSGAAIDKQVKAAREKLAGRAAQLTIRCPAPLFCKATVDGVLVPIDARTWVRAGDHEVEIVADGTPQKIPLHLEPGAQVETGPTRATPITIDKPTPTATPTPTPSAPAPKDDEAGLAPVWFWASGALTVAFGGLTLWSGLDTKSTHDAFVSSPSDQLEAQGKSAQTRTNVFAIATAAAGITTGVLAFYVRWSGPTKTRAQVGLAGPVVTFTAEY
jgi:hypothetical protein